ncbi:MAG: D-alanyl-D-alanine carboxypeptidase/D-alanyl-D-alanine-endopeptidase [bacterium]|jgi:D-alanyl-D-alanine carboxypeptidase/D-alanyl-D-alanine-endopeptidase (penicillin-binding protein 4)
MRFLAVLLVAAWPVAGQTLQRQVESLIRSKPAAERAFWGVKAVDLTTGQTLVSINSGRLFRPASNTKLFTTAFALSRLGPEHVTHTVVTSETAPDQAGRISGDLTLIGGGDPTLKLGDLADRIVAAGVRAIDGDIVGDDTAYEWEPYPEGWTIDDSTWDYGAPVSALALNDNVFRVTLSPGPAAGPPVATLTPASDSITIDNRVRWSSSGERDIVVERGEGWLRISGTMPRRTVVLLLAGGDPALNAAQALREALLQRGVAVRGRAVARHRRQGEEAPPQQGIELARIASPPLLEVLRTITKDSQNLYAEMVLREAARASSGGTSRAAGLAGRKAFLAELGITEAECALKDGSGLARQNFATPNAIVRLLERMHASRDRDAWLSLLPTGGKDGTLAGRFGGSANARRIRAKTGTLDGVSALSGYADRARGGRVAFSILVNNYAGNSGEIRSVMDRIALLLAR